VLEHLDGDGRVKLADAPFVEGAVAAAVSAASGLSLTEVVEAAEESRGVRKL
jgi:dihydroxyacetone kinase DhaKLM complex PTS-EIIA-like component DhaM